MYNYILRNYTERNIEAIQVYTLVPLFLTQEQADKIVASPRKEVTE